MAMTMRLSALYLIAIPVAIVLMCAGAAAAERQEKSGAGAATLPPVEVSALRDPVEKSYRRIVRGMDLFEKRHELAPNARLRFKLLPRRRETNMQGIALTILGERVAIPVTVAPDNTFVLPRSQQALKENAV